MIDQLLKRAQEIKARNALLASTPGTGYHDNDARAPQNRKPPEPRLDTHIIRFEDPRGDLHFVGDDAHAIVAALHKAAEAIEANPGASRNPGSEPKIGRVFCKRYQITAQNGDIPHLQIWHEDWNDVLLALQIAGVGVTGVML